MFLWGIGFVQKQDTAKIPRQAIVFVQKARHCFAPKQDIAVVEAQDVDPTQQDDIVFGPTKNIVATQKQEHCPCSESGQCSCSEARYCSLTRLVLGGFLLSFKKVSGFMWPAEVPPTPAS